MNITLNVMSYVQEGKTHFITKERKRNMNPIFLWLLTKLAFMDLHFRS